MSFDRIKGQDSAVAALKEMLASKRIPGGLLFIGNDGVGKALTARSFAKALNCDACGGDACGGCSSCKRIEDGSHPDVLYIEPAGKAGAIKIDEIRRLKKWISFKAYEAEWRVCIIRDAHLMTHEASNALLKTLEEPPRNSCLLLTAIDASRLLPTVVSRCRILRFASLRADILAEILISNYKLKDDEAHFVSMLSGGGLKEAERWAGADILNEKNEILDSLRDAVESESIGDKDFDYSRDKIFRVLDLLEGWYRDVLVTKLGCGREGLINRDRAEEITLISGSSSLKGIMNRLKAVSKTRAFIEENANRKIAMACMLADLKWQR